MSDFIVLEADQREVVGKKVKRLREAGLVPGVIYGPETDPVHFQANYSDLRVVLQKAGGTQLVEIQVGGETYPTLARDVQRNVITGDMLHVDFYLVSLTRLIAADVPVILVNDSPAVVSGAGMLVQGLSMMSIEALPAELPPQIEVDISVLTEVGMQLLVGDLDLPTGSTSLTDLGELVVKIDYIPILEEEEDEDELEDLFLEDATEPEVITARGDDEDDE